MRANFGPLCLSPILLLVGSAATAQEIAQQRPRDAIHSAKTFVAGLESPGKCPAKIEFAQQTASEPVPPGVAAVEPKAQAPRTTDGDVRTPLGRVVAGQPLLDDLDQCRSLLKHEWLLSKLNDADFDAAIDAIAQDAQAGMTLAELTLRLQRVLAMGGDGHAGISDFPGALQTVRGVRPQFVVDLCGGGYVAFFVQRDPLASVNPRIHHRFRPLKEGYPYLVAIDGLPMEDWVRAASQYVPKGPDLSMRWRSMRMLLELPILRRDLRLPDELRIRVRLASSDRKEEIELDAPTGPYQSWHFQVPKPDWRIIDDRIGYIWIPDGFSLGEKAIFEAMPKLRDTKGLILDLRSNTGGGVLAPLQVLASYLLPPDHPRQVVGQIVRWKGDPWPTGIGAGGAFSTEDPDLSPEGRALLAAFRGPEWLWNPPSHRTTESRAVLMCRAEVEPKLVPYNSERFPKTDHYGGPVVVLTNHRCFSSAELFIAAIKTLPDVTLVGSATTAAGGGSPKFHRLKNSGLEVMLAHTVFVRADGTLTDGIGIKPDIIVEPDADYYLGARDRMLERAIEVLKGKIAARK